jgi:hypothetical protein
VIGIDLQCHGRTSLGDREISLVDMDNGMAGALTRSSATHRPMRTLLKLWNLYADSIALSD